MSIPALSEIDGDDTTITKGEYYRLSAAGVAARAGGGPHATVANYRRGCRCADCRAALAQEAPQRRRTPGAQPLRDYLASGRTCGRIATYNAGCRCDDCRDAARIARARARRQARERQEAPR